MTAKRHLTADSPAVLAVCQMAETMLLTARRYEQGLLADIDIEFLHQYRVNIRKSRSLISLFKKSLPKERYKLLKSELKTLGSSTNTLRDLDVFLLNEGCYRDMLPTELQSGLTPLFSRVKRRRRTALKKVLTTLNSEDYRDRIERVRQTLRAEPGYTAKQAQIPIKDLVCKKVLAQYRQICSDGAAIEATTADESIHELRINCKKLRYLLELFSELFNKKRLKQLVRHLKDLQDNLGRCNDYSVQRKFLHGFAQSRGISEGQLASINGLSAALINKQRHECSLLAANLAKFTDNAVSQQFTELFGDPSREDDL